MIVFKKNSLVRLTLPGYNNFSRSLSVIVPRGEWVVKGVAVLEEETGADTFEGLDEIIAWIGFGSRGEVWPLDDIASN